LPSCNRSERDIRILPRAEYLRVLQISSAHVYLTYPFVLSWSLLEAMGAVIASDTSPLQEIIDKENGLMVPFFDVEMLSNRIVEALSHPRRFKKMRAQARRFIERSYGAHRICLPQIMKLVR
jgi:glycosyltransferase involved in cell wall biosynthesis